jgi:hypothetical protein
MSRRGARPIFFVCSAIIDSKLVSEMIEATTVKDAQSLFFDKCKSKVETVFGPFYKKRTQVLEVTTALKFSKQTKTAQYNGWLVNAFMLQEPQDCAYLIFIKKIDNSKASIPKGTVVVPITELRFE